MAGLSKRFVFISLRNGSFALSYRSLFASEDVVIGFGSFKNYVAVICDYAYV